MHRVQVVVLCRDQNLDILRVHGKEDPKYGSLLGTNFWSLLRDQLLVPILGPTFGPYSGTTLKWSLLYRRSKKWTHNQGFILVPILGPHSGPWIKGPNLGTLEGP